MVPLKLQLKNFLSYGPEIQNLDFEPYHLICLSGKNGHGKSALLDALTWVLWGQARKVSGTSKADDGLIRLNQNHMMVSLDFMCSGITYRVRREFSLHQGKAVSHLDFGIVNTETQQLQALTDKTIRGTQEKINASLGLDYDAFVNSAFLRQGQSNEFSKKSARERKEILASILGLERYEVLRKKASDKMRIFQQEKDMLTAQETSVMQELNNKTVVTEQLQTIQNSMDQFANQETQTCQQYQQLEHKLNDIIEQKNKLLAQQALYGQTVRAQKEYVQALTERINVWRTIHRQQHRVRDQAQIYQSYALIEQKVQALQPQLLLYRSTLATFATLKEQAHQQKEKLVLFHSQRQQTLAMQQATAESTLAHNAQQSQQLHKNIELEEQEIKAINTALAQCTERVKQLDTALQEQSKHELLFERRKQQYHRWIEMGNVLKERLADITEKQKKLDDITCSQCPLCLQNLPESTRTLVLESFNKIHRHATHQIQRFSKLLPSLKQMLVEQHATLAQYTKDNQEREILRNRITDYAIIQTKKNDLIAAYQQQTNELLRNSEQLKIDQQRITTELQMLGSLENLLEHNIEYKTINTQLAEQQKALTTLESVEQEYQTLMQQLNELSHGRQSYEKLMQDIALQQERSREITKISQQIKKLKLDQQQLALELKALPELEQAGTEIQQEKNILDRARNELVAKKETLLHQRGALEHQKALLERKEQDLQKTKERLTIIENSVADYQAITQALGKDGIQALLIEEALPDIEQEANTILAKLTDNQAHIIIESLRDLKSGSTKETLDIKISDSLGIRPYEMFSGGEAFRIDFALRIAISKLLARRAGATMQLLIIDEGFGSQDEEGLAHIMDMLYKIQDSFAKIVIVSHLASLKEQFPIHFVVQKTPQGSMINIVQNG